MFLVQDPDDEEREIALVWSLQVADAKEGCWGKAGTGKENLQTMMQLQPLKGKEERNTG